MGASKTTAFYPRTRKFFEKGIDFISTYLSFTHNFWILRYEYFAHILIFFEGVTSLNPRFS